MSKFSQSLEACSTKTVRQWLKKNYWARAHKTATSRDRSKQQADDLWSSMSNDERESATTALSIFKR